MIDDKITKHQWEKNWAGKWSLLTSSYLGYQYTRQLKKELGISLKYTLFISRNGYTSAYFDKDDKNYFGKELVRLVTANPNLLSEWTYGLKKATDKCINLIEELLLKDIETETFNQFIDAMYLYGVFHRAIKVSVDYLDEAVLSEHIDSLEEARIYAEPVYEKTEIYMRHVSQIISEKEKYIAEHILATTKSEFEKYLTTGNLPDLQILADRYKSSAIFFDNGDEYLFDADDVDKFEEGMVKSQKNAEEIRGQTAYKGVIKGVIRVVSDPLDVDIFNSGDILVTGMTRPEYLDLIKKSGAYITDAGGTLSHAAITARELEKPCIVGTKIATQVLKDGMEVEVDADEGVVRILNNE